MPSPGASSRPGWGGTPWGEGAGGQQVSCLSLTGYWSVTVFGRKHCYRLYTEHLNEAVHWVCAVQKVIDSKAPVQTPTQLLMRDIEVSPWHGAAHTCSHPQGRDGRLGPHVPWSGSGCLCQALGRAAPLQLLPSLRPPRSTAAAPRSWSRSTAATRSCATPAAPSTLLCCPSPTAAWTKAVRGRQASCAPGWWERWRGRAGCCAGQAGAGLGSVWPWV